MIDPVHLLLYGLVLLAASSVPFIPTGELVAGAAALTSSSIPLVLAVFVITVACAAAGDLVLLSGSRLFADRLRHWRAGRRENPKVRRAERWLLRSTFTAVLTCRLIPGMRAPVIIALGLSGLRRREFVLPDLIGCAAWAAIYTLLGTVGGRLTSHPVLAVGVAVLLAVGLGLVVGRVVRRQQDAAESQDRTGGSDVSAGRDQPTR